MSTRSLPPVQESSPKDTRVSLIVLLCACLACLLPFVDKAFHIDDPLFLWVARQIQLHPLDFYGFNVNWYGYGMPMFAVTKNPPLASYYIAGVASLFGWGEGALHLAFLLPAFAAAAGMFYLAREFCAEPLTAALVGLSTPVFLISSTTVMCDTMMIAFWVWATYFWILGVKRDSSVLLIAAAFLITLAALTKYFGMSLIPLLFVYSLVKKRRPGYWTLILLVPVLLLAGYQIFTGRLYGRGLLSDASSYALERQSLKGSMVYQKALRGLSFTGGCFLTAIFFLLPPRRWRTLLAPACIAVLLVIISSLIQTPDSRRFFDEKGAHWLFIGQFSLFLFAGITFLSLAASELWRSKDAGSLLLMLWILGTFVFASFLNWTVNGRSVLPIAPALGILIARRRERGGRGEGRKRRLLLPLIPSLCVALFFTWTDYTLAGTARSSAATIGREYRDAAGTIWFEGHWGFQYYMEANGGAPLASGRSAVVPGDVVILPLNNSNVYPLPPDVFLLLRVVETPLPFGTTMQGSLGAGFYSDVFGPLPFALGFVPPEKYYVLGATRPYVFRMSPSGGENP